MAQLHDDGYQFIGPTAVGKLTVPEIRILKEGQYQNAQERKQKQRAQQKSKSDEVSETRMNIEKSHDQNDADFVEDLASN